MTTSGTYTFNPSLGELTLYAYNLIGIRSPSLVQEHFQTARMAVNMMGASWSNQGVNLWAVDLVTVPLVQGTTTYSVDPSTVMILDAYIETVSATTTVDRPILPISRTEYASYPNKIQQGFPTVFWFDRLIAPTVTIWPVPDGTQTYLKYYRVRQIQDSNLAGAQTAEIPFLWLEAFSFGLAFRLGLIWAPEKAVAYKPLADEAYTIAASQNVESSNFYIAPMVGGYYR